MMAIKNLSSSVTVANRSPGEIAYELLRDEIILCRLAPGEEVSEAQLEQRYGLTRACVRKALQRLSQENLVRPQVRVGHLIAPLSLADIRDVFLLRRQIEPMAARMAAGNIDEEAMRTLDAACMAEYVPGDEAGEVAFLEANRRFHIAIGRASGSQRLASWLEQLHNEATRILYLGFRLSDHSREWVHGHETLLSALVAPDPDEAARIALVLLENSEKQVVEAAINSPVLLNASLI